jgi:hypothetical protein
MPKKNLEILESEDKTTKGGMNYVRFKTNEGWMSCFDKKSAKALKDHEGESVLCEVVQQGDFQNIKKFLGGADEDEQEDSPVQQKKAVVEPVKQGFNQASMYVSYTKDLFISLLEKVSIGELKEETANKTFGKIMEESINLVKQAKDAFEEKPKVEVKPAEVRNLRKDILIAMKSQPDFSFNEEEMPANFKASKEEIDAILKQLLDNGIIFEPKPNFVKYLG